MKITDLCIMLLIQTSVVAFALYSAFKDAEIRKLERTAEAVPTVIRSDIAMKALYTVYGAAIASSLVLIDNASGLDGHKVLLIIIDFICINYVFFFSTWFRNAVFFPLIQRVRKD